MGPADPAVQSIPRGGDTGQDDRRGFCENGQMDAPADISQAVTPSLLRRLAAMAYDALALFGVLVVAAAILVIPLGVGAGYRIPSDNLGFRLYLLAVILGYFAWPWTKGGQTLGMRAWRIRVLRADGGELRWRDALLRLAVACLSWAPLGLGFVWVLVDRERLAWHDRLSATRLVMVRKSARNENDRGAPGSTHPAEHPPGGTH